MKHRITSTQADQSLTWKDILDATTRRLVQARLAAEQSDPVVTLGREYGFTVVNTGGGCEALSRELGGGLSMLLTAPGDPSIPASLSSPVALGLYSDLKDDNLAYWIFPTLREAMAGMPHLSEAGR